MSQKKVESYLHSMFLATVTFEDFNVIADGVERIIPCVHCLASIKGDDGETT